MTGRTRIQNEDSRLSTQAVQMIDVRELAKLLRISTRHVERSDAAGLIPAPIRLSRSKRWRLDEIKRWLTAGAPDRES